MSNNRIKIFVIAIILLVINFSTVFLQSFLHNETIKKDSMIILLIFCGVVLLSLLFYYCLRFQVKSLIARSDYVIPFTSFPKLMYEYVLTLLSQLLVFIFLILLFYASYYIVSNFLGNYIKIQTLAESKFLRKIIDVFFYIWFFPLMYLFPIVSIKRKNYKTKEIRKLSFQIIRSNWVISLILYSLFIIMKIFLPFFISNVQNIEIIANMIYSIYSVLFYMMIVYVYCKTYK